MEYNSGSNRASNFEIGRARGRFEITSTITPWIVRHEVQLLINRNYNKIREEYDSGLNYLTGLYIQLLSYMPKKKSHSSATSASSMTRTVQLLRHDAYNCPITAEIRAVVDQSITSAWRVQLSNYGWNQGCCGPIRFENFDIVVINCIIVLSYCTIYPENITIFDFFYSTLSDGLYIHITKYRKVRLMKPTHDSL